MKLLNKVKSFKTKLLILIVSITFIVLLAASLSLAALLNYNFKNNLDNNTRSSLAILAYNLAPAVSFADDDGVRQLLSSFKTSPDVVNASVYGLNSKGELALIASYSTDGRYFPENDVREYENGYFNRGHFEITVPITVENDTIGYLYQYSISSQLNKFYTQVFAIITATLLTCLLLGVIISLRFQHFLLAPLLRLVEATKMISQHKDYSIRVEQQGHDEFSLLSASFNQMLDEIELHNQKQQVVEEEIRQLNLNLENKVTQRTTELAGANQYLQNALTDLEHSHNQLVEQEKMASLGALVAGIAHEINTPLGIGVTAVSHLSYLIKELSTKFSEKNVTRTYMQSFLDNAEKGTEISLFNLFRAADIISNFKLIAVDQSSDQFRTVDLNAYIGEIILSLHPKLKRLQHKITVHCDETLQVYCRAGALVQIITNLVMNSIIHGFENKQQGNITITALIKDHDVHIYYEDDGCGMPAEALCKLFEPFYTTRRGKGGSGLGAHLVYNLVTQSLNGHISVSSEVNNGLKYDIEFPARGNSISTQ
jgi:signal transduction histidine kinase